MRLKSVILEVEAKKPIIILNKEDSDELGLRPLDRVEIIFNGKTVMGILNITEKIVDKGCVGLYFSVDKMLGVKTGDHVDVRPASSPDSLLYIRERLNGKQLNYKKMKSVVDDVVASRLSDIETTAFVVSLYLNQLTMEETTSLSKAMTDSGKTVDWGTKEIYDKHSIGGCPGDKSSLLLVPIIASAGLTIPKTSSRAITSPAGTADRAECLFPVDLSLEEIKKVVKKTNGCIVWGGAVNLSPADDLFIQIEYPLSIDPLLLPSVMSKKKSMNSKYVVIDIPTGKGTKIKTIGSAQDLAKEFIHLGKNLEINVECLSTFGEQPIGYGIGAALEAKEALITLSTGRGPPDLIDKAIDLAAVLFSFKGIKHPHTKARDLIKTGKAYKKLKEIIEAQGGDPKIKPSDISIGDNKISIASESKGRVLWINNNFIVQLSRVLGSPKDKGAGILLKKKIGDVVQQNDVIFEMYAEKSYKLNAAENLLKELNVYGIGDRHEMQLSRIPNGRGERRFFLLDR